MIARVHHAVILLLAVLLAALWPTVAGAHYNADGLAMPGVLQKIVFRPETALTLANRPFGAKSPTCSFNPFGKLTGKWGPMADANEMRFSSMPWDNGIVFYPVRAYFPELQRWGSPDPGGERHGINLYQPFFNSPLMFVDRNGRDNIYAMGQGNNAPPAMTISVPAGSSSPSIQYHGGGFGDPLLMVGEMFAGGLAAAGTIGASPKLAIKILAIEALQNLNNQKPDPCKEKLDQLYPRVKPKKGMRDEVWNRNKSPDGKVYDPSGVEIKPEDPWELGHNPGDKFSDAQQRAYQEGWDSETWKQYQNDPDIYRPELPSSNAGHEYESDW